MKLFTKEIEKAFEMQGDTSHMHPNDTKVVCKLFMPDGGGTWWIYDRDRNDPDVLWTFASLGDPDYAELGTVLLSDLEKLRGALGLPVERDRHFPILKKSLNDVYEEVKGYRLGEDEKGGGNE